jgi:hypothetical protein
MRPTVRAPTFQAKKQGAAAKLVFQHRSLRCRQPQMLRNMRSALCHKSPSALSRVGGFFFHHGIDVLPIGIAPVHHFVSVCGALVSGLR